MATIDRSELRKRVLRALKKEHGISMPTPPEGQNGEIEQFPKDMTSLSDIQVRQQMSYWKAMSGFTNTLLARSMVDEKAYKREARDYERQYKFRNKPDKSSPMWEVEAGLADDQHYRRLTEKLEQAEAMVILLKSVRDAQDGYYTAASRELTARTSDGMGGGE
jgi:hypothetical protein